MNFFSEDYLMHYGVRGMKWKKRKNVGTIDEYLADAHEEAGNKQAANNLRRGGQNARMERDALRMTKKIDSPNSSSYKQAISITNRANAMRNADLKKARKKAYKKNQRRIARQQLKAKIQRRYDKLTGHNGVTVTYHDAHVTSVHGGRR